MSNGFLAPDDVAEIIGESGELTPREALGDTDALRALLLADIVANALQDPTRSSVSLDVLERAGLLAAEYSASIQDGTDIESDVLRASKYPYDRLKDEYIVDFKRSKVDSRHSSELKAAGARITSKFFKEMYKDVESRSGVPWFVIGALHYREASLNFMGHLHCGDYLKVKTIHVPRGRPRGSWPPVPWDPIEAWKLSAVDALQEYKSIGTWTVSRMLYTFESFNGWGYRGHPGFRSPYLWNYTQLYDGGGFPRDHVWSSSYKSKQAGLVSILKTLSTMSPEDIKFDLS